MNRQSFLSRIAIVDAFISQLIAQKGKGKLPTNEINLAISDLSISKQKLLDDLSKLDFMTQFKETPWVIKKNPTHPTYYQLISVVGKLVTLSRKGNTRVISYDEFYRDYVEATEDQVLQHIQYLTKNNIKYLFKPVKCDLSDVPVIDFSGSGDTLRAIEAGTIKGNTPPAPKKSADADFYCVTLKQGRGCTKYHATYELAETEAVRLSKQENKKAYVLGVVAEIETIPTTTYEVKTKKF